MPLAFGMPSRKPRLVPISQTLDINFVHNYAKRLNPALARGIGDGFVRNQGVGTWEMNWAAFLVDLNTNFWPTALSYNYDPRAVNFLNSTGSQN